MVLLLRIFAALFALRGLTNVLKPLGTGSTMVFFGQKLPITHPLGPLVGVFLLVYAYGLWSRRSFAVPMGIGYAIFATLNVALFYALQGLPDGFNGIGYLAFAVIAIGVPWAAPLLLRRELRASPSRA